MADETNPAERVEGNRRGVKPYQVGHGPSGRKMLTVVGICGNAATAELSSREAESLADELRATQQSTIETE